jgi:hypothetical protein
MSPRPITHKFYFLVKKPVYFIDFRTSADTRHSGINLNRLSKFVSPAGCALIFLRFVSDLRSFPGFSYNSVGEIVKVSLGPELPGGKTELIRVESFVNVGRIAMCDDGLEIHSDLDQRGFIRGFTLSMYTNKHRGPRRSGNRPTEIRG